MFNLTAFINNFSERSQSYNEKHKNLLKHLTSFIVIFFKLFFESKEEILRQQSWGLLTTKVYFVLTLIEKFQNFTKSNEGKIRQILTFFLNHWITDNNLIFNDTEVLTTCKLLCFCYSSLPKLANDYNKSFNILYQNILKEISHLKQLCNTITFKLKNSKDNSKAVEKDSKTNMFVYKSGDVSNSIRLCHSINGFFILFKLLKYLNSTIPMNVNLEIDFNFLFNFICKKTIILLKNTKY